MTKKLLTKKQVLIYKGSAKKFTELLNKIKQEKKHDKYNFHCQCKVCQEDNESFRQMIDLKLKYNISHDDFDAIIRLEKNINMVPCEECGMEKVSPFDSKDYGKNLCAKCVDKKRESEGKEYQKWVLSLDHDCHASPSDGCAICEMVNLK